MIKNISAALAVATVFSLIFTATGCKKSEKEIILKQNVKSQLQWDDRVDESTITVSVNDNSVTLKGTVSDYDAWEAAQTDAWSVLGVHEVNNKLEVDYPVTVMLPDDEKIETRIENMLQWDPVLNDAEINVSVSNGAVTLSGNTDSYWKKWEAEKTAAKAYGVISTVNKLSVVPTEKISDELIAEDIVESMNRNLYVNTDDINVKVKNGDVTLSGTADNWREKKEAFFSALYTAGVTSVDNLIVVMY